MSSHEAPTWRTMAARPHHWIALSLGLGLTPHAPGTAGAVGGIALFAALQGLPAHWRIAAYIAIVALASWAVHETGRDLKSKDHNSIVIDETIGMSLTLEFAPMTIAGFAAAFVLFRLFDVWKPWPVYLADQRGGGGFLVILDDILAAAWAALCILLLVQMRIL